MGPSFTHCKHFRIISFPHQPDAKLKQAYAYGNVHFRRVRLSIGMLAKFTHYFFFSLGKNRWDQKLLPNKNSYVQHVRPSPITIGKTSTKVSSTLDNDLDASVE